jgi:hypothetical protein
MKTQLGTIDTSALETVTGGTMSMPMPSTPTPTPTGGGSSSGSSGDAVLASLQGIASSLKDLNKGNGGLFGGNSMLLLGMILALRRNEVVVYSGSGYGHDHGYGHGWG